MKISKLSAAVLATATAFCALSLSASVSHAADCEGDTRVTVSGTLSSSGKIVEGKRWLDVESSSPCTVEIVEFPVTRVPSGCVGGASFTATGRVEDFLVVALEATSLSCQ